MNFRKWFEKEKWLHVHTLLHPCENSKTKEDGNLYIHLFESSKGNRRIEFASSFPNVSQDNIEKFGKSTEVYQTRVVRWLSGRRDPEIPRYDQVGEEDVAAALKGHI